MALAIADDREVSEVVGALPWRSLRSSWFSSWTANPAAASILDQAKLPADLHCSSACFALVYICLAMFWNHCLSVSEHWFVDSQRSYRSCIRVWMLCPVCFLFSSRRYFSLAFTSVDMSFWFWWWDGSMLQRDWHFNRFPRLKSMSMQEWLLSLMAGSRMKAWSTYCSRLVLIEIRSICIDPQLCVAGRSAKKSVKGSTMSVSCRRSIISGSL